MFGLFKKNPLKKLDKAYRQKLKEARDMQRTGDLRKYAALCEEAEQIAKKMDDLRTNA